jgi:hypothetical protein
MLDKTIILIEMYVLANLWVNKPVTQGNIACFASTLTTTLDDTQNQCSNHQANSSKKRVRNPREMIVKDCIKCFAYGALCQQVPHKETR